MMLKPSEMLGKSLRYAPKLYRPGRIPGVLKYIMKNKGWEESEEDWTLSWRNARVTPRDLALSKPTQIYNHFPETDLLTNKGLLSFNMKKWFVDHGKHYDFYPVSFSYSPAAHEIIKKCYPNPDRVWISKPYLSSRGRGIRISKGIDELKPNFGILPNEGTQILNKIPQTVVQEYVPNPFLVSGYKLDLRIYVLVTSFHPLKAYIYEDGLVRLCTEKYSNDNFVPIKHLTNTSIHTKLMRNGSIEADKQTEFSMQINESLGPGDFSKRRLRSLFYYLYTQGYNYAAVWRSIKKIIMKTLIPLTTEVTPIDGNCFELFGFDVLLTDELEPKLVEVNLAPSLEIVGPTDQIVKMPMLEDMLDVVMDETPNQSRMVDIDPFEKEPTDSSREYGTRDMKLLFPFNLKSAAAAKDLADGINTEENLKTILEEIDLWSNSAPDITLNEVKTKDNINQMNI